jgi:penicillin amidase
VAGAAAPWLPGVIIGHNDAIAWGMTSLAADTQDVFVERVNPANPRQVREGTRWVDVVVRKDAIAVKRRDEPFEYEQLYTKRGVVVALDPDRQVAYTVRWSGAAAGGAGELAALSLGRARSWTEFQDALTRWRMPPAVFVYADRDGHIATQQAVAAPTRRGWDGKLPAPGWTGEFEWTGWTANRSVRSTVDPPSGFVISANDSEPRLHRIEDVLRNDEHVTVAALKQLQHDTYAWNADRLVRLLAGVSVERADVEDARQRLLRWNRHVIANSVEAALYVAWERALTKELLALKVPSALAAGLVAAKSAALAPAIVTPSRAWFGDDSVKARDNLLAAALTIAIDEIKAAAPRQITFIHPLALTDPARRRFNVGPFAIGGYAETVRAMSPSTGPGSPAIGASFLAIFDTADWDRSVVINPPGQSEWPQSPHFSDLARLWASEDYVPLAFNDEAVAANLETTLTLIPKRP